MSHFTLLQPLRLSALLLAAGLAGCASTATPVVYQSPNRPASMAPELTRDLAACRHAAEAAVGINSAPVQKVSVTTARRGAVEFIDKAVDSAVSGARNGWQRARGASAGAMAGTLTTVALNWNEPDSVHREYVDLCLKERGHRVLGWR
jgi:hypothetical protein